MTCNDISTGAWSYVEGTMPQEVRREADEHLSTCPRCRQQIERLHAMDSVISGLKAEPVSPFASGRIRNHLESVFPKHEITSMRRPGFVLRPVLILFAATVGVLSGLLFSRHSAGTADTGSSQSRKMESFRSEYYISDLLDEDKSILSKP